MARFFDVGSGSIRIGGADVRDIAKEELMDTVSFVFQNSRLIKGSILDEATAFADPDNEAKVQAASRNWTLGGA